MTPQSALAKHHCVIMDVDRQLSHSNDHYQYLCKIPAWMDDRHKTANILRLSTIIEILEDDDLVHLSNDRIAAYTFMAIRLAVDGATGHFLYDFRSIRARNKDKLQYSRSPLVELGIGEDAHRLTMEQIWLKIPKLTVNFEERNVWAKAMDDSRPDARKDTNVWAKATNNREQTKRSRRPTRLGSGNGQQQQTRKCWVQHLQLARTEGKERTLRYSKEEAITYPRPPEMSEEDNGGNGGKDGGNGGNGNNNNGNNNSDGEGQQAQNEALNYSPPDLYASSKLLGRA
ncbi:unnamed protein product [Cylicocyclus nassatus]|uniref:Uncharacterized protein n=1 Tax=Cylicocyclus nassatus TaxID=53992 RepID=A0AA36GCK0_CYLNA|nr:unnamed protein product [Cylicocyclus nassatus]